MKGVLVQLERTWIYLTTREEIYRTLVVFHLYILIIADEESSLCQFKNVLDVTNWADDLACGHVLYVRSTADRRPLNLFHNATFAKGIAAV